MQQTFKRTANYSHLTGVKQKEGESSDDFLIRFEKEFRIHSGIPHSEQADGPYQQQLKNALLKEMKVEFSAWLTKHFAEVDTASVSAVMQWARHAEKILESMTSSDVFWTNDIPEKVYYHQGARPRGRGRGAHTGGGIGRGRGQSNPADPEECWNCKTKDTGLNSAHRNEMDTEVMVTMTARHDRIIKHD